MSKICPSIPDVSGLTTDERNVLSSLRELEMMSGVDASTTDIKMHIQGITSAVAALTRMATAISHEDPETFKRLSVTAQYIGGMLWEWYLRSENNEQLLCKMEELGRSSAKIGRGLFPLDDATHPAARQKP